MEEKPDIELVYDRQCPACEFYCRRIDVGDAAGRLVRIDARVDSDVLREATALGLDVDEGIVVKAGNRLYYGAEAISVLAQWSSNKGLFNRVVSAMFRSPAVARVLYPPLRSLRNLLLKLLGRTRINNLHIDGNTRF